MGMGSDLNYKEGQMQRSVSSIGGGRVGWLNSTWPFASFNATSTSLTLKVWPFGTYAFTPEQVVSLERYGLIPFFGWGVRINHIVPQYPEKIVFWCLGNPNKLITKVRELGFVPVPTSSSASVERPGFPVRWQAIVTVIVIWNVLLYLDWGHKGLGAEPGPLSLLAILMVFLLCFGIRTFPPIQKLFLKEGREPEEIASWLNLLTMISGLMLLVFSIQILAR